MIRVAVLGSGRIGKIHASNVALNESAKLVAVADPFGDSAAALSGHLGCEASLDPEATIAFLPRYSALEFYACIAPCGFVTGRAYWQGRFSPTDEHRVAKALSVHRSEFSSSSRMLFQIAVGPHKKTRRSIILNTSLPVNFSYSISSLRH